MDDAGTQVDLLIAQSSGRVVKNGDHKRSMELAIAAMMLPAGLVIGIGLLPLSAGIGGTQGYSYYVLDNCPSNIQVCT